MAWIRTGWATVRTSPTLTEVIPEFDVIDHKSSFACKCNPIVESMMSYGEVHWHIIHNAFDEFLDDDLTEPYKGI